MGSPPLRQVPLSLPNLAVLALIFSAWFPLVFTLGSPPLSSSPLLCTVPLPLTTGVGREAIEEETLVVIVPFFHHTIFASSKGATALAGTRAIAARCWSRCSPLVIASQRVACPPFFVHKHALSTAISTLPAVKPTTTNLSTSIRFSTDMGTATQKFKWGDYPKVRRDDKAGDTLHGVRVPDPYRHLEDPEATETKEFVQAQAKLTDDYLAQYPHKKQLEERLTKVWDYPRYGCPTREGNSIFYWYNSGLQAQAVLYRLDHVDDPLEKAHVFFDPNLLSKDGTVALSTYAFSEEGTYFGYALSKSGSDWVTIHVKRVSDGKDLSDEIHFGKFTSIYWTLDEKGFFYTRYPAPHNATPSGGLSTATSAATQAEEGGAPAAALEDQGKADESGIAETKDLGTETDVNLFAKTYYHRLGTSQDDDLLVYEAPDQPQYRGGAFSSFCGKYIILSISASTAHKNMLWIAKWSGNSADLGSLEWHKAVNDMNIGSFSYLTNDGPRFYFQSNAKAPNEKIVVYDFEHPDQGFKDLIPENPKATLAFCKVVDQDKLILVYMEDVKHVMRIHDLASGRFLKEIDFPIPLVAVDGLSGRRKHRVFYYRYSSFLSPGTIVEYDWARDASPSRIFKQIEVPGLNPQAELEATQEFYTSKDGTRVPMFIIRRKDHPLDGSRPCLLYGYGGFNIALSPMFAPSWIVFIQAFHGAVAMPSLRGGGEYGETWHEAGMLHRKQTVFDDFQAAAKHLVQRGFTSHQRLAINGVSNGGLLIGACINQAPELFGAAVAEVGVMDMLRFQKFSIGHAWCAEYGNADTSKEDLEYLLTYSPLHTVRASGSTPPYPATLVMTSDHDDRVVPLHSFKYISELQYRHPENPHPLLIRIEQKAGHGAGKPTKKQIESAAQKLGFIAMAVGATWHD